MERDHTLTALDNARPAWPDALHRTLDAAVFAAYGWPDAPADAEILERRPALNGERAGKSPPPVAEAPFPLPCTGTALADLEGTRRAQREGEPNARGERG